MVSIHFMGFWIFIFFVCNVFKKCCSNISTKVSSSTLKSATIHTSLPFVKPQETLCVKINYMTTQKQVSVQLMHPISCLASKTSCRDHIKNRRKHCSEVPVASKILCSNSLTSTKHLRRSTVLSFTETKLQHLLTAESADCNTFSNMSLDNILQWKRCIVTTLGPCHDNVALFIFID